MYIQSVVYDSSCEYNTENSYPSACADSLYDLTKDYVYIVNDEYIVINELSQLTIKK